MDLEWVEDFKISTRIENDAAVITANREGLLSLAKQLAVLSGEKVGNHIHYDEHNSLEEGSIELIIERVE